MSAERWGVTVDGTEMRGRATSNGVPLVFPSREKALRCARMFLTHQNARVVKLAPKGTKRERHVLCEGLVREGDGYIVVGSTKPGRTLAEAGLIGKRVRVVAEVLPDEGGGT